MRIFSDVLNEQMFSQKITKGTKARRWTAGGGVSWSTLPVFVLIGVFGRDRSLSMADWARCALSTWSLGGIVAAALGERALPALMRKCAIDSVDWYEAEGGIFYYE